MRRLVKIFAVLAAGIFATDVSSAGENDVLYWMIDSSAKVEQPDGKTVSVSDFFGGYTSSADSSFAARVRVTGGGITEDTFLSLYVSESLVLDGELGVGFDTVEGHWGAGVPEGNQSPLSAADYSVGSPEFSFIIELGNVAWDEDGGTWTTIATSGAAESYQSLANYIHQRFELGPGQSAAWTPTQFVAVPEPSGGILVVLGAAFLALRRRRFKEGA